MSERSRALTGDYTKDIANCEKDLAWLRSEINSRDERLDELTPELDFLRAAVTERDIHIRKMQRDHNEALFFGMAWIGAAVKFGLPGMAVVFACYGAWRLARRAWIKRKIAEALRP